MERLAGQLLASLSAGVVAIDGDGAIACLNPAAARILGLPAAAVRRGPGRPCEELLAEQPALVALLRGALAGRGALSRAELELAPRPGASGAASTLGLSLAPIRDARGRIRGAAALFRDLAPIEREGERERQRERLAALGQTAAGLAHEIRNPLAGMEVIGGLLARRMAGRPEESALMQDLLGQIRRVAATVSQCLDFVRPPALSPVPLEPVLLCEEALALARLRIPFEGCVQREYAAALPEVLADAEKLRSVLIDVIANALEAMEGDGVLSLRIFARAAPPAAASPLPGAAGAAAPGGRELVIAVADTGPGVPDELREKIFYPFFTTRERGSGVGLANAQKVLAGHGGHIELASKPGSGASFELCLPAGGAAS